MNLKVPITIFCMAAAATIPGGPLRAAAEPDPDAEAKPDGRLEVVRTHPGNLTPSPVYHVFGGQPVELDMAFTAGSDSRTTIWIFADVFQKAQSLLAPLKKDVSVRTISPPFPESRMWRWTLPVPEVKRETEMLVRFRGYIMHLPGQPPNGNAPTAEISLKVYPKDFIKDDLAQIAKDRRIHVFGVTKAIRDFLNEQKVEYADEGSDFPNLSDSQASNVLYLGNARSAELTRWLEDHSGTRANVAVFCPDAGLLPGVFESSQGGIRLVKVTIPLLENLTTDPRSQKTLLEILSLFQPAAH